MLHRESREIVNTGDHLTISRGETSCRGWDLRRVQRAPNQYCTTCANVPEEFRGGAVVIVCGGVYLGKVGKGWEVLGGSWVVLGWFGKC